MKLKNKNTGEIVEVESCNSTTGTIGLFFVEGRECDRDYSSLAELNEEWEDYEEPKEYWYIDTSMMEVTYNTLGAEPDVEEFNKQIGNYFETKEEAEKAVEKLKAWKRLKDKGFRFTGYSTSSDKGMCICYRTDIETWTMQDLVDFKTLFGGEE